MNKHSTLPNIGKRKRKLAEAIGADRPHHHKATNSFNASALHSHGSSMFDDFGNKSSIFFSDEVVTWE